MGSPVYNSRINLPIDDSDCDTRNSAHDDYINSDIELDLYSQLHHTKNMNNLDAGHIDIGDMNAVNRTLPPFSQTTNFGTKYFCESNCFISKQSKNDRCDVVDASTGLSSNLISSKSFKNVTLNKKEIHKNDIKTHRQKQRLSPRESRERLPIKAYKKLKKLDKLSDANKGIMPEHFEWEDISSSSESSGFYKTNMDDFTKHDILTNIQGQKLFSVDQKCKKLKQKPRIHIRENSKRQQLKLKAYKKLKKLDKLSDASKDKMPQLFHWEDISSSSDSSVSVHEAITEDVLKKSENHSDLSENDSDLVCISSAGSSDGSSSHTFERNNLSSLSSVTFSSSSELCSNLEDDDNWSTGEDKIPVLKSKRRRNRKYAPSLSSITCRNCQKKGHTITDCINPYNPVREIIKCHICNGNHEWADCRNIICSNCLKYGHGEKKCFYKSSNIYCNRCKMRGHMEKVCPDLWRRYHITVSSDHLVKTSQEPDFEDRYCYNCAKRGHFGFECKETRMLKNNFPALNYVISYDDTQRVQQIQKTDKVRETNPDTTQTLKKTCKSHTSDQDFKPLSSLNTSNSKPNKKSWWKGKKHNESKEPKIFNTNFPALPSVESYNTPRLRQILKTNEVQRKNPEIASTFKRTGRAQTSGQEFSAFKPLSSLNTSNSKLNKKRWWKRKKHNETSFPSQHQGHLLCNTKIP